MSLFGRAAVAACLLASARAAPDVPVCDRCHPAETRMFLKSPMGNSLGPPSAMPAARITHALSGSVITVEQRGPRMFHILTERGLTAEYPVDYQVGSGKDGYTYLVRIAGYFMESPASWYRPHGWDTSPGYHDMPQIDFDRLVDASCLSCHSDRPQFTGGDYDKPADAPLTAISCGRCHGSANIHVRHPSATNIVNPAKLPLAARDSICEQCHLEGEARVLQPGRHLIDFEPGETLEQTVAIYVPARTGSAGSQAHAVSQAEQLAGSQCVQASGGKLWCATCHNPHRQITTAAEVRQACLGCHGKLSAAAHPNRAGDCVSCHMPRLAPDDIPHSATTDHRIRRRPDKPDPTHTTAPDALVAWREPPPQFRDRDQALADLMAADHYNSKPLRDAGTRLLNAMPVPGDQDVAVWMLLARSAAARRDFPQALAFARRAAQSAPDSAQALDVLAGMLRLSGDTAAAETSLVRATALDPPFRQPWIELARLYRAQSRMDSMLANMERYLAWNPQSIGIRLQKAQLAGQSR